MAGNELMRRGSIIDVDATTVNDRDERIDILEKQKAALQDHLNETQDELRRVMLQTERSLANLRRQLRPLYQSLQQVFGELDAVGVPDGPEQPGTVASGQSPVWTSWKTRLGGTAAKVIDALLLHGEMNAQQLASVCGLGKVTVYDVMTKKLIKNGLIEKNGGRYALKKL